MHYSRLLVAFALAPAIVALPSKRNDGNDDPDDAWRSRVKNVVVLVLENRSFDNLLGDLRYDGDIDGLVHTKYCNPVNASIPNCPTVYAQATAKNVAPD